MGSKEISKLKYHEGFAFIGQMGNAFSANERRAAEITDSVSVQ